MEAFIHSQGCTDTLNLTINKEPSLTKHLAYSSLQMRLPLAATF